MHTGASSPFRACLTVRVRVDLQGRPPLLVDMRIVDGSNRELLHDGKTPGDLQVRGPHVISRYFRVGAIPVKTFASETLGFIGAFMASASDARQTKSTCLQLSMQRVTSRVHGQSRF